MAGGHNRPGQFGGGHAGGQQPHPQQGYAQPQPPQGYGPPPPQGYMPPPPGYMPQQQGYGQPHMMQAAPTNSIATWAMVCGICAFLVMMIPYLGILSLVFAPMGIILGAIGISKANKIGGIGKGKAVTGLILGIAWIAMFVLIMIVAFSFIMAALGAASAQ